jgi:mRNA-degrading endonuclease RelE of RelBE toxin-antitoxin system
LPKKEFFVEGSKDFMKVYESLPRTSQLKKDIDNAISELKKDPLKGERIQQQLWPKEYVKKYGINNLFRYRLGGGYRLTYTIVGRPNGTTSVILDALTHKDYDKLFGYSTS